MLVSVIIPSFNCAHYLPTAIESALSQSYKNVQVIVVDDGSTDDTRHIVQSRFPRVSYIYQPNAGLPAARNTGIRHAVGDLIAFLDADDWWHADKLSRQVPQLLANPSHVLVHSDVFVVEECNGIIRPTTYTREDFQGDCYELLFERNYVLPSAVVVRRDKLVQAGCFDESFRFGCEDYDMWIRLARRGTFAFVSQALVYYRKHDNNMSSRALKMALARVQTFEKTISSDTRWQVTIGTKQIRRKMSRLYADVAWQSWYEEDFATARTYARRALVRDLDRFMTQIYLASFLSPQLIRTMLRWRERLLRQPSIKKSRVSTN